VKKEDKRNMLDESQLEKVSGGGLFDSDELDAFLRAAGCTVKEGIFSNDYYCHGELMEVEDMELAVFYYNHTGQQLPTINEMWNWYDTTGRFIR
jgi:hypothetical protein